MIQLFRPEDHELPDLRGGEDGVDPAGGVGAVEERGDIGGLLPSGLAGCL